MSGTGIALFAVLYTSGLRNVLHFAVIDACNLIVAVIADVAAPLVATWS